MADGSDIEPTVSTKKKRSVMGRPKGSTKLGEPLQQVSFRLPVSLLERVDCYAQAMRERDPARGASRVDAVRELLGKALATFERRK